MKNLIKNLVYENLRTNIWYHGTPDVRDLEKDGGFNQRYISATYVNDINEWEKAQAQLKHYRESGNDDLYFKLLDEIPKLKVEKNKIRKPIFLTNKYSVAKTYADPHRSYDYQNAKEKVVEVSVNNGKGVKIYAPGERFRFINTDAVVRGFVNSGIDENKVIDVIKKFTYATGSNRGIKTDTIAIIGDWFDLDYIDVEGVLDSYSGGNVKSTVKMVLNPQILKIVN